MFLCLLSKAPIPPVPLPALAELASLLLEPLQGRLKGTKNLAPQSFPPSLKSPPSLLISSLGFLLVLLSPPTQFQNPV